MKAEQVNGEFQNFLGLFPSAITHTATPMELTGQLYEKPQVQAGSHYGKLRELIGIALSALSSCPHCAFYHTELARVNGATEGEIDDAFREPERYLEKKMLLSLPD